jgi:hypothetical protein
MYHEAGSLGSSPINGRIIVAASQFEEAVRFTELIRFGRFRKILTARSLMLEEGAA